ncbi:centrosomal protein of 295 kDa isoform X8 [Callithrix jacchus]
MGRSFPGWLAELRLPCPGSGFSELSYIKYIEMKRKVVNARKLRLSPNEEAFILKEDYERRRKLRLLQVREQERDIALQIREDVKQRRNQQFTRLAEELRAEWEESQTQKIKNLEKLYLASLRSMGEGHRQAKENEPDLDALAQRAAERKRKADLRHKEALKVQKKQKEILMKQKTWHIKARKEALLVEKERSAKITSLPPPPPTRFENIEIKRISAVKTNSSTYHHLHTFVNREIDTKQPDAHLAAEEEAKRLEELQKQAAQERMQQFEKAHVRGFQAMKKIHLAQNQEKLMKELKQLQQEDLARRRQTVAQMPPQLVELPYKRSEMKEDWQRELEFAFEDMYNADRKVKGNLILHLEPEPLPTVTDHIQDEELDLSMEQENLGTAEDLPVTEAEIICSSETDVPLAMKTQKIPSKVLFKKLLNKIRSQKSLWTIQSMSEDENEMITTVSEIESKAPTIESGTLASEERMLSSGQEQVVESDTLTIESGPLTSEDKSLSCGTNSGKEQEIKETLPITTVAQSSVLLHPQEEAARIRKSARQKQIMEIEEQKQKQLELLEQIEQQKLRLETDCFKAQLEEENRKKTTQQTGVGIVPASCTVISDEDSHRQLIRNYQHQLLQQNRLHRQSVETARKRLLEYQTVLKGRCPWMSAPSLITDSTVSVPSWKSERPRAVSEHWDQGQRLKLSPNKYQPIQPIQTSKLEQGHFQEARQNHFPQRQVETTETLGVSNILTNQSLKSQEHLMQFSQTETQQRDYKLISEDSETLSRALSHDRQLVSQDARKISETFRVTTFQSLDSQQMFSENSENTSSKPTEPSSFVPLLLQHSFSSPPVKVESGKMQEPFSTMRKSTVSTSHAIVSQMHDRHLLPSENIIAQQGNMKALQEQLDLQKKVLQARQEAQEQLLLCKQKELEQQTGLSVFLPLVTPNSSALLPSAKADLGSIQESSPAKNNTAISSDHHVISQLQDRLLNFSQPILSQQNNLKFLQEQLNIQKDSLQARREAQEVLCVHKQSELDGRACSEQSEPSSLPFQIAQHIFTSLPSADRKPGKIQEQYSSKSEKGLVFCQSDIPKTQDGSSSFLQQFLPLHDSLKLLQEQLTKQRDTLQAQPEAQVALLLHRQRDSGDSKSGLVSSSSLPMVVKHSVASQASAKAEPRRISQHILPLQDNLEEHQAWLDTEKFSRKTQENTSSEQTGSSSFVPQLVQLSFTSLASAESGTILEPLSIESESKISSTHLQIPQLQNRLLRISQLIQPQQDNLKALQEKLATQREAIILARQEAREELLLHKWSEWEGRISPKQVDTSSLPLIPQHSFASLPLTESERNQEPCSINGDNMLSSGHAEISRLPDGLLGLSHVVLPQQDNLIALEENLHTQTDFFPSIEKTQKELILSKPCTFEEKVSPEHFIHSHHSDLQALQQQLDAQKKAIRSSQEVQEELLLQTLRELEKRVSSEQISSSSYLSQIVLPVADSERTQKSLPTKSNDTVPSGYPEIPRLQDRLLSLSQSILPQEDNLTAQLDVQREVMYSYEKSQGELPLNKQTKLNKSESAEHTIPSLLLPKETEHSFIPLPFAETKPKSTCELYSSHNEHAAPQSDPVIPAFQDRLLSFSQPVLAQQDNLGLQKQLELQREVLHYSQKTQEKLLVQRQTALQQQIQKHDETLKDFLKDSQISKPTVGNDLKTQKMGQLKEWFSNIQDLAGNDQEDIRHADRNNTDDNQLVSEDSSAKQSGKPGVYQERDPLRVSISREQNFFASPMACYSFGCLQPVGENVCGDDHDETVKVKESVTENHAVLSYAVEEEHTYLGPSVKPDDKTKTLSHEPLSSATVSTGSLLSYENTDLSLIDPVDLDFPELEHIFPNLHHQLFKPLEPHPDFDLSSSSGISPDNRDFYQRSDSSFESHCATGSSKSTIYFTALRTGMHFLNQQPDINLAHVGAHSFATENIMEGAEQSFEQLLPECSSQEGSQHADLPSIFSTEARDSSQDIKNQNYPSEEHTEVVQNKKKSVHFQLSIGNLSSVCSSSDEANVFHQLNVQHSTPCGSNCSECSIKHQLESRKERMGFEELPKRGVVTLQSQGLTEDNKNESCRVLDIYPQGEETDSQFCVRTVEMGTSVQAPHSLTTQKYSENSPETDIPKITNQLSEKEHSELFASSGSLSLQSSIPVWETESGHGIMEEPELTLVSTSDISIAEIDFTNLTLEEKGEDEAKSCLKVSEFLPLVSETEASDYPAVSELSIENPKTASTESPPRFTPISRSLQEAFIKRKKTFMERSHQRQKEITIKEKPSIGSSVSRLKGVNKVRALPEERQTTQALRHQRSLRLCNQLAEVKQQKEQKAKQEAYAQNRARAKEFHKKTLEKLRAKNTC